MKRLALIKKPKIGESKEGFAERVKKDLRKKGLLKKTNQGKVINTTKEHSGKGFVIEVPNSILKN